MKRHFENHNTMIKNKFFFYLNNKVILKNFQTQGKRKEVALSEEDFDEYIKLVIALYKISFSNDIILK